MTGANDGKRHRPSDDEFTDTIAAVITPPGEGGIAAVRMAGNESLTIARRLFHSAHGDIDPFNPFMLRLGRWCNPAGAVIDEVTAVYMPAGRSYTGLEQVEIFCHGGRQAVRLILQSILDSGARAAEAGEFTRLAFLNGRIDLARAEAVAELVAANTAHSFETSRQHLLGVYSEHIEAIRSGLIKLLADLEASIDFTEEDLDHDETAASEQAVAEIIDQIEQLAATYSGGRIIREGFKIVIAGRPNAGKSSLFNLLLRQERALVNPTAGTTRDYLSEWIDLDGFAVNLIDTAGLRLGGDDLEQAGQNRARQLIEDSNLVLWLVDVTEASWPQQLTDDLVNLGETEVLVFGNKTDLLKSELDSDDNAQISELISCLTGRGIGLLKAAVTEAIDSHMPDQTDGLVVTSARHHQKLCQAADLLREARSALRDEASVELVIPDLKAAVIALDELTGRIYTEEILGEIFASFCIGK
jgi:tRNA modification GTPase